MRMTRRTFVGAACGSLCAAGKLQLGIGTYTYHCLSMDDMIVQLKRLEIREIEMSRGRVHAVQQAGAGEVRVGEG